MTRSLRELMAPPSWKSPQSCIPSHVPLKTLRPIYLPAFPGGGVPFIFTMSRPYPKIRASLSGMMSGGDHPDELYSKPVCTSTPGCNRAESWRRCASH